MVLLAAGLSGLAIAGAFWATVHSYFGQTALSSRLSKLPADASVPIREDRDAPLGAKGKSTVNVSDLGSDRILHNLFLAGIRNWRTIRVFQAFTKLSFILPSALGVVYLLSGRLSSANLFSLGALGLGLFLFVHAFTTLLKKKRQSKIVRTLPEFFDLLVVCIEAGLNFTAALPRVIKECDPQDPLVREFAVMYHEYLGGLSMAQACERLAKRCGVPDLSVILNSVVQCDQMGTSLANTLRVQADELRDKYRQRMREKAHQISVKILFPIMLILGGVLLPMSFGPVVYKLNRALEHTQPAHGGSR